MRFSKLRAELYVYLALLVCTVASGAYLVATFREKTATASKDAFGTIEPLGSDVRRRGDGEFSWNHVGKDANVFVEDRVFTGTTSRAKVRLKKSRAFLIEPESLIRITDDSEIPLFEFDKGSFLAELVKGAKIRIKSKGRVSEIESTGAVVRLESRNDETKLIVLKGNATIRLEPETEPTAEPIVVSENQIAEVLEENVQITTSATAFSQTELIALLTDEPPRVDDAQIEREVASPPVDTQVAATPTATPSPSPSPSPIVKITPVPLPQPKSEKRVVFVSSPEPKPVPTPMAEPTPPREVVQVIEPSPPSPLLLLEKDLPVFSVFGGFGVNYIGFEQQSSQSLENGKFAKIKAPSLSGGGTARVSSKSQVMFEYRNNPGEFSKTSTTAIDRNKFSWSTLYGEYQHIISDHERNRFWLLGGVQIHDIPFLSANSSGTTNLVENEFTNLSIGAKAEHMIDNGYTYEALLRYQIPVSESSASGLSFNADPKIIFDGSIGVSKQFESGLKFGLHWSGQYWKYAYSAEREGLSTTGSQTLLNSTMQFRIGFDF